MNELAPSRREAWHSAAMTFPGESRFVDVNGVRLHARVAGSGPVVLMVHGFPGSSYSWRHQLEPVAAAGFPNNSVVVKTN